MTDVDRRLVERVLVELREEPSPCPGTEILCDSIRHHGLAGFSSLRVALDAVARDPSLFRAVELRRAELLRQDSNPASGEQTGRCASASTDGFTVTTSAPAAGAEADRVIAEFERDMARLTPLVEGYYVTWREFGASPTCINWQDGVRCRAPAHSIIAFVKEDRSIDISTFCKEHGDRVRAVLRAIEIGEQDSEGWESEMPVSPVMPGGVASR